MEQTEDFVSERSTTSKPSKSRSQSTMIHILSTSETTATPSTFSAQELISKFSYQLVLTSKMTIAYPIYKTDIFTKVSMKSQSTLTRISLEMSRFSTCSSEKSTRMKVHLLSLMILTRN